VNSRLLLATPTPVRGDGRTALVCPKQGDRPQFWEQLKATGDSLRQRGYAVIWGTDVDEETFTAALGASREVIILCHGVTSASASEGPGICVAAGGTLPPSTLLVERDPALHAFVVTWRDLISLESTPQVVISLACSSGRTRSGRGGTRIGLDQALVGRSTSHLISPVWNVAQASALDWLQALTRARTDQPLRDAYRTAVLDLAGRYPHPYHWAPFTLRSHYQGDQVTGGTDGSRA
jgi:CHAT domain-containing protein